MSATLGLDIGPNSIGWALLDEQNQKVIDAGVRVFPEGVDAFDTAKEASRNDARRTARGMRRQILRRKRRRKVLRQALIAASLFPADSAQQQKILDLDPYVLRRRAVAEKLDPFEIGRVMLHLNQRRGFQSNSKKDRGDKEVKGMLQEINELEQAMAGQTLGQYLANAHNDPHLRIRGKHTRRAMLRDEFNRIWSEQARHHPGLLTQTLRYGEIAQPPAICKPRRLPHDSDWLRQYGLEGILFFQRAMFWPKSMIGICELEPKERRCPRADRAAQRFRLLQEVNNLRFIDPDHGLERALDEPERALLLDKLATVEKLDFSQIRKLLGFIESVKFNLERGERSKLLGLKTDYLIAKAVGKSWHKRAESQKDQIVRLLTDLKMDDAILKQKLMSDFTFDEPDAQALMSLDLPSGYVALSLKAINKLLPFLEKGMRYMADSDPQSSALHAAGYLRRDELARRLFGDLPALDRIRSGPLSDLPNPVVKAALHELRKVVNAIIRQYGKPAAIHVELARSMKMNQEKRAEYNKKIRDIESERDAAADELRAAGVKLSRESITRYLLWKQQGEICIYTGQSISLNQLFAGEVDVDHILPWSRCLDDSQMNKIVCYHPANHQKTNRSPHEWLADSDPSRYEEICQRARRLPYPKYRKFLLKNLELDDFIARQLVDTAYITRLAMTYLKMLTENDHDVLGLKGAYTADLRHQWGLETILSELPDSPAWQEDQAGRARPGEKNRADHRHHAIDAIVVALTDRSRLQQLSHIRRQGGTETTGEILPAPWDSFRRDVVEKVKSINVSHRPRRKVAGPLHEESLYGPTKTTGEFVKRKPVTDLTTNEIELIRDPAIRKIVADAVAGAGVSTGRKKRGAEKDADSAGKIKAALADLKMPSGVPIRRVRIVKPEQTIQPIRLKQAHAAGDPTQIAYVKPGSTHHLCLFEWEENGEKKRDAIFVTMLEATQRLREGKPIIQRVHPERPQARFVMSLSGSEMVLADWQGQQKLLTYKTAASTQGQIYFCEHTDARRSSGYKKFACNCNTLDARKVTVDPLGRIRWAGD